MVKVVALHSIQRRDEKTGRIVEIQPKGIFDAPAAQIIELLRVSGPINPAVRYANEVDAATAKQLAAEGVTLIEKPERLPRKRADGSIEVPDPVTGLLPSEAKAQAEREAAAVPEDTRTPAQKRADTIAANKAASEADETETADETAAETPDDESADAPVDDDADAAAIIGDA